MVNVNINGNFRNPIDTIQFLSQDVMCFLKQGKLGERQKAETHSVWEHYVSVCMNRSLVICVHPPTDPPDTLPPPFIFCFFLMLLSELIGNMFGKRAHAQRAGESTADTHQLGRRPDSPPLCRATSQDAPLTTTMLIEVLIRRPGPNWQRLMGKDRRPGHGLAAPGCLGPRVPCSGHFNHTRPSAAQLH